MLRGIFAVLIVLITGLSATAQPSWELTETLELPDAGFSFSYPKGFTLTRSEDGHLIPPGWEPIRNASVFMTEPTRVERAYFMTEFESDVAAATDSDNDTVPRGTVISLIASPLADWGIEEFQGVYDLSFTVADMLGMSTFVREPIAVMGKFGVSCEGFTLANGRTAINVIWIDDGIVYVLGIFGDAKEGAFVDDDSEMRALLQTLVSTSVAPLDRELEFGDTGLIVSVPSDWTLQQDGDRFELREFADSPGDGMVVVLSILREETIVANDVGLESTDHAIDFILSGFDFESPSFEEAMIAGEYTLYINGRTDFGTFASMTPFMFNGNMLAFMHFAPDNASLEHYETTFHAMVASVRLAEPTAED